MVRVRGYAVFHPTAFTTDQEFGGAYGLGVVSDEALAAGATSIPRPFDDDDWTGWLVHGFYAGRFEFASGVGIMNFDVHHIIDSKAMRKVRPNEALVWVCESQTGAIDATIHARVLMMLS